MQQSQSPQHNILEIMEMPQWIRLMRLLIVMADPTLNDNEFITKAKTIWDEGLPVGQRAERADPTISGVRFSRKKG